MELSKQTIPYVISEAHPDYKRPWINNIHGIIGLDKMTEFFLEEVAIFILDRTNIERLKSEHDITNFWINSGIPSILTEDISRNGIPCRSNSFRI